jgi:hypothetical protein
MHHSPVILSGCSVGFLCVQALEFVQSTDTDLDNYDEAEVSDPTSMSR